MSIKYENNIMQIYSIRLQLAALCIPTPYYHVENSPFLQLTIPVYWKLDRLRNMLAGQVCRVM